MTSVVYLIDDDVAVRNSLALVFRSVQLEVEAFGSAEEFLSAYRPQPTDKRACLVTDVRMPGMSGLELQNELSRRGISMPVIVISGHADVPQTVRAMRAGALTVLQKPVNEQDLIDTIHQALSEAPSGNMAIRSSVLDAYRSQLTERQREVFDLLMRGLLTKDVARQLNLSHRTVEAHRAKILERLQIGNFSQLLRQLLAQPGGEV